MYVISIALAIFGLLSWGNISAQNASNVASQQNITSKIALESKELLTFAQGALDLTTEIGAAGGGESISLATLESNHLLPRLKRGKPFGRLRILQVSSINNDPFLLLGYIVDVLGILLLSNDPAHTVSFFANKKTGLYT